jgi:hypothetical protein
MWGKHQMHQLAERMRQGRWREGGRQVTKSIRADSQIIKVSNSITNSVITYDMIMAVDTWDHEGKR